MAGRIRRSADSKRHRLVHARFRRRGRIGVLRHIGPGLITGAADDDPSGIGTYSQLGAQFRFAMLWTVPVSLPLAAAVEELAARLGLAGGEGLASLIKKTFPPPVMYFAAALVAGANTFNIGADLGSMVASLQLVIPIPFVALLITITAVLIVLEVFVQYHQYARLLRFLTLSLFAYIAVLAVVHVDWSAVAANLVIPHIRANKDYLAGLVAIFGTTISPYLMFSQCSHEVDETADRRRVARGLAVGGSASDRGGRPPSPGPGLRRLAGRPGGCAADLADAVARQQQARRPPLPQRPHLHRPRCPGLPADDRASAGVLDRQVSIRRVQPACPRADSRCERRPPWGRPARLGAARRASPEGWPAPQWTRYTRRAG